MDRRLLFSLISLFLIMASALSYAQKKPKGRVIVPAWRVQIVDESGKPMKSVLVRETWQDWDVEEEEHHEDVSSNDDGYANFPARMSKASRVAKVFGRAKHIGELGVHAGIGVYSQVWAYGQDPHIWSFVNYEKGKPLPERIVLKRWDVKIYP